MVPSTRSRDNGQLKRSRNTAGIAGDGVSPKSVKRSNTSTSAPDRERDQANDNDSNNSNNNDNDNDDDDDGTADGIAAVAIDEKVEKKTVHPFFAMHNRTNQTSSGAVSVVSSASPKSPMSPTKSARASSIVEWKKLENNTLLHGIYRGMDDLAILPTDGPFRLTRVATNKESGDSNAPQFSIKIAAFDMDGTLICPNGKHVHAKNASDWKFYAASVPDRLRQLYIDGYTVVVFSNQAHILQKERHGRYTTFTGRVEGYAPKIGCPLVVFAAAGDDAFRKPRIGMWNYLLHLARQQCGNDARVTVDWDTSFYVGDAAGRLARKVNRFAVPKDHSEADWRFAQNVGIRFLTPEEYFMDLSSAESGLVNVDRSSAFVPRSLVSSTDAISPSTDGQELIVMVGFPASGKSSFAKQIFVSAGYVYINQDTLRSAHRCLSETKTALAAGQSVVVDNTNRDAKTRKPYVDAAKQYPGCRIKCVFVDVGLEHARHNNYFRSCGASKWLRYDSKWTVEEYEQFVAKGDAVVGNLVPKVAYNTMASQLEEPATTEGFNEVVRLVPPLKFTNKHDETVWRMYFTD